MVQSLTGLKSVEVMSVLVVLAKLLTLAPSLTLF